MYCAALGWFAQLPYTRSWPPHNKPVHVLLIIKAQPTIVVVPLSCSICRQYCRMAKVLVKPVKHTLGPERRQAIRFPAVMAYIINKLPPLNWVPAARWRYGIWHHYSHLKLNQLASASVRKKNLVTVQDVEWSQRLWQGPKFLKHQSILDSMSSDWARTQYGNFTIMTISMQTN